MYPGILLLYKLGRKRHGYTQRYPWHPWYKCDGSDKQGYMIGEPLGSYCKRYSRALSYGVFRKDLDTPHNQHTSNFIFRNDLHNERFVSEEISLIPMASKRRLHVIRRTVPITDQSGHLWMMMITIYSFQSPFWNTGSRALQTNKVVCLLQIL